MELSGERLESGSEQRGVGQRAETQRTEWGDFQSTNLAAKTRQHRERMAVACIERESEREQEKNRQRWEHRIRLLLLLLAAKIHKRNNKLYRAPIVWQPCHYGTQAVGALL